MGSFIEMAMSDAPELRLAPEAEYDLRVVSSEVTETKKKDRHMLHATIKIEGAGEDYELIHKYMVFPNRDDWENQPDIARNFIREIKRFLHVFGIEWQATGFDADEVDGATGSCLVTQRTDEESGRTFNDLRLPRLPADAEDN